MIRYNSEVKKVRIFALQLNNDIRGLDEREEYIESLISRLDVPELVVLPELSQLSYIGNTDIWQYADQDGQRTASWAMRMAEKYHTIISAGYLEAKDGDYYNAYMIADSKRIFGKVYKSEGESFIFKRGDFPCIIETPFGNVAVGICYDSRRKHFYDAISARAISLILFPHGEPSDPKHQDQERATLDFFCRAYIKAFGVPVVYCNSIGAMGQMLGKTGAMMSKAGFALCGNTKIYGSEKALDSKTKEAVGGEIKLVERKRSADIRFYGHDIVKGNLLFRNFVIKPDIRNGVLFYEQNKKKRMSH